MIREEGHPILAHTLNIAMRGLMPVRKRVLPWATGRVLEIGCGTGINFPLYRGVTHVTAIEPDPHMRKRATRVAATQQVPIDVQNGSAMELPWNDNHFDTVVVTFVLCTIPDPEAATAELYRVLRPDGVLIFAEHVGSHGRWTHSIQRRITPMWSRVAGGCRLDNPAEAQLRNAGFSLELQSKPRPAADPFPVIYGFGKKGAFRVTAAP